MSFTVNLYYTGKDGSAAAFADEMESSGLAEKIRSMPGNLRYAYYQSLDDPQTILLVDSWQDQAALDAHHDSDIMKDILALRDKYHLSVHAERYVPQDFTSKDQGFLAS